MIHKDLSRKLLNYHRPNYFIKNPKLKSKFLNKSHSPLKTPIPTQKFKPNKSSPLYVSKNVMVTRFMSQHPLEIELSTRSSTFLGQPKTLKFASLQQNIPPYETPTSSAYWLVLCKWPEIQINSQFTKLNLLFSSPTVFMQNF